VLGTEVISLSTRLVSVVLVPMAIVPSGLYLYWGGRSTVVGNLLAVSYAHNAISMVKLDSVRTGVILLIGLFVYDVWWVFGTDVVSINVFFFFFQNGSKKGHTDGESGNNVGCADQIGVAESRDDAGTGRCGCAWAVCGGGTAGGTEQCAWSGRWVCGWTD